MKKKTAHRRRMGNGAKPSVPKTDVIKAAREAAESCCMRFMATREDPTGKWVGAEGGYRGRNVVKDCKQGVEVFVKGIENLPGGEVKPGDSKQVFDSARKFCYHRYPCSQGLFCAYYGATGAFYEPASPDLRAKIRDAVEETKKAYPFQPPVMTPEQYKKYVESRARHEQWKESERQEQEMDD